ncbi:hypothetical protein RJ639_026261 [Escallonia herrerae]|uniref:Uncharacterized protein n=1 Tax=Escallonia herrerae TaxID=1293975 RepID=A0AA88UY40_9ASTE|nr:hypothetical protein RJ639_026261 [Escallonia herrerae]
MAYGCYLLKSPHCVTGHVGDASRSYYQGQRSDPRLPLEKQGNIDPRSQSHEGDTEVGYENNLLSEAFEGLEQRFLDDIIKLAKEQTDAEDAENARHREVVSKATLDEVLRIKGNGCHGVVLLCMCLRMLCNGACDLSCSRGSILIVSCSATRAFCKKKIMTINAQYEEQLAALRTRHTNRREEFLRKESHARQQQYQQAAMDQYPNRGVGPGDPHGYSAAAGPGGEPHPYSADQYDSYRERARYLGGARDRGFDPKGQHPGGRVYNTGSRYY